MISVCMATYNGQKYIKEQIDSILCQLGHADELVISDDHSTDLTPDIIKSYDDKRIKFFYNELKKGVTHNFENALLKSKGDILFLADQDDVWLPGKLEKMVDFMQQGGYDVVECNCALVDENLNVTKEKYYCEGTFEVLSQIHKNRRKYYEKICNHFDNAVCNNDFVACARRKIVRHAGSSKKCRAYGNSQSYVSKRNA